MGRTRVDLDTATDGVKLRFAALEALFNTQSAELETRLIKQIHDANLSLVKWMIGTVLPGASVTIAVLRLLA